MRIKRVECDQFAGVTGKELELDNGLNIVVGENESGKSTIVDLIYQLLFKDIKLDGRSDSDFIDRYFPKKVEGPQGDVIDGLIVFETPSGTYKLKKEWEKGEGTCRLTLPDGTSIKGNAAIKDILAKELKFRAGVYNEIVFASQKRDQIAIESIMRVLGKKTDPLSDTRADLASTLTQAALETGGVSLDKVEKSIQKNKDDLIGRWDWNADMPEGGAKKASYKNPWVNGAGTIVKAYYEVDEVRSKQTDAENAELAVEAEKAVVQEIQLKKKGVEAERTRFQNFRGLIGRISLLTNSVKDLEEKIKEQNGIFEKWPKLSNDLVNARELRIKQKQAQVRDLFLKAEPAHQAYLNKENELKNLKEVDAADRKSLRELVHEKQKAENELTGMNLVARIRKLGSAEVSVTTAASGKALDLTEGEVLITEAVNINIPGIMDMQLMPKGVDVEKVKRDITDCETEINKIYEKYGISSSEALDDMADAYAEAKQKADELKLDFDRILGDNDWDAVKAANAIIPADIETTDEIRRQIEDLCGFKTVDAFIGGLESTLNDYENKYKSIDDLKASIEKLKENKEEQQRKLDFTDEIPEEFRGIDDPDRYDAAFLDKIEDYENQIQDHYRKLSEAERKLGDKSAEEYSDELQEKEAVLEARKAEYEHWQNIYNVFSRLKEQCAGNPVEDIEARFREYLGLITEGSLKLYSMDEQLSVQLASGTHSLTYDTISNGTKDAISLAFRLAMLEHLYPEGDGLAVFDDPFTEMDAKRVEQSCKLIQKFAENNQVIFVTCDDKYQNYMSGNVISVAR